ncbi:hypothetical protein Tco_1328124 [Tanacetum coccineum]
MEHRFVIRPDYIGYAYARLMVPTEPPDWNDEFKYPKLLLVVDIGSAKEILIEELGINIVSFDRPGYGESDPDPKRTQFRSVETQGKKGSRQGGLSPQTDVRHVGCLDFVTDAHVDRRENAYYSVEQKRKRSHSFHRRVKSCATDVVYHFMEWFEKEIDDETAMSLWHPNLKLLLITLGDQGTSRMVVIKSPLLEWMSTLRPANILVFGWAGGKHACVDLTGVSPLVGLKDNGFVAGQAALKAESSKVAKHEKACLENQHVFIPFAFDTFGILAPEAEEFLNRVQRVVQSNFSTPKTQNFIFSRIGFAIQKGVAAQLVARLPAILL